MSKEKTVPVWAVIVGVAVAVGLMIAGALGWL